MHRVAPGVRQLACLIALLSACSKEGPRPAPAPVPAPQVVAEPAAPSHAVDESAWIALSATGGEPARPLAWSAPKGPRLLLFGATWCPSCTASVLVDQTVARSLAGRVETGVILLDDDDDTFIASHMARNLHGMTVWNAEAGKQWTGPCHVVGVPAACLLVGGKVAWTGPGHDALAMAEAAVGGDLRARQLAVNQAERQIRGGARPSGDELAALVHTLHGLAGTENGLAWDLADQDSPSPADLEVAVALAADAVATTGAADFAILDTYALALAKAGDTAAAAKVGQRVIAVCDLVHGKCSSERERAERFIRQAGL